jgi:hypothetical protein
MSRLLPSLACFAFAVSVLSIGSVWAEEKAVAEKTQAPVQQAAVEQALADGIYKVTFSSPDGKNGTGLVVISGGAVNGGDPAYTYQGRIELTGSELKSTIDVIRYNKGDSIFGPLDNFQLELNGKIQEDGKAFTVSGSVKSQPELRINLAGNWVRTIKL